MLKSKRILLELVKTLTNNQLSLKGRPQSRKKVPSEVDEGAKLEKEKAVAGWSNFSEVFMVSSITGNGLSDVLVRFVADIIFYVVYTKMNNISALHIQSRKTRQMGAQP